MLIKKALETSKSAGKAERITIDGKSFNRLPINEPVLWVTYDDIMQRIRTLEEVVDVANQAKHMIDSTGLSWSDYRQLPEYGPGFNSKTSIWLHYDCALSLFSTEFIHEDDSTKGLWYYDFDHDFVVIVPRDASHMLIAKHFPTEEEYLYLKGLGFVHKSLPIRHIEPSYVFFLDTDTIYDAKTLDSIIVL